MNKRFGLTPPETFNTSCFRFLVVWLSVLLVGSTGNAQQDLSFASRARVLEHWIKEQISYHGAPGVVVAVVDRDGLVWSEAFGLADREHERPMETDTRLRMGSVSKIFTATAIVKLRDQGKLNLDDPVALHLPWFTLALRDQQGDTGAAVAGERFLAQQLDGSSITIRHLLTHTGGLPREANVPYWTDHAFPSSARLASAVVQQMALWPPGRNYQYSNLGVGLLGEIVAAASGSTFAEYLADAIFQPLGMHRSTASPNDVEVADLATGYMRRMPDGSRAIFEYYDTGALAGAANVISTLEDMARFAALHLRSADAGKVLASQVVMAPESLREMHRSQWVRDSLSSARGLGFSISVRKGQRVVSHGGWIAGHRSHLILVPQDGIAVVAMVNADDVSPSFFAYEALDVLSPVWRSADRPGRDGGTSSSTTSSAIKVNKEGYAALEGTYSDPWGSYYEVMDLAGDLYFYEHVYPPADTSLRNLTWLEPTGEGDFVYGGARDEVRFERGDSAGNEDVVRILRRTDYLFPVRKNGSITVSMPRQ